MKTVFQVCSTARVRNIGPDRNVLHVPSALVEARDVALVVSRIHNVGIGRIGRDVSRFSAADRIPVLPADFAVIAAAGDRDGRVVLLRAIHIVRIARVGDDVVKLRRGLIVLASPCLTAVQADRSAAVVARNHAPGIFRINPQPVIVAVRNLDLVEGAAPIGGPEKFHIQNVNRIGILRIGDHVHVIPGPLIQGVIAVYQIPRVPAVIGAKQPTVFRFDNRVHAIGIRPHRQPNSAVRSLRQSMFFQPLPGCAAIGRAVEPAPGSAAGETPRRAPRLPQRRKQNVRIPRIERNVDGARVLILIKHFIPGLAAIQRAENSALRVRTKRMPERRHKDNFRVARIHNHLPDRARILQPDVLPGLPCIHRLPHAIAVRNISANAGFARPHIDNVRVRLRHRQAAYGRSTLFVKNRRPTGCAVGRLPHSSAGDAKIVSRRIARNARRGQ